MKRWLTYEVSDGTEVALVVFSDVEADYDPVIYHMEAVNNETRAGMIEAVDDMEFDGRTCIGCGLDRALNFQGSLKGVNGGVIILITNGEQDWSCWASRPRLPPWHRPLACCLGSHQPPLPALCRSWCQCSRIPLRSNNESSQDLCLDSTLMDTEARSSEAVPLYTQRPSNARSATVCRNILRFEEVQVNSLFLISGV